MNVSKVKCIGIDLTQHKPMLAIAEGRNIVDANILSDNPPQALLPISRGESVIAGVAAHKHRRGMGSIWPPECQAPVYGNALNGVGRIPLVCAWAKFVKLNKGSFSGITGNTDISWRPQGKHEIFVSAERLITDSVKAWTRDFNQKKIAVVIPDSFNEAAQQALLDNFNAFLTPRPVAVALSWCRRNAERYQGIGDVSEEGNAIGHLLVVTLAFDQWEIVPIEIRARKFNGTTWLVPVRNRNFAAGGELPRFGVGLFTGTTNPDCDNTNDLWRCSFALNMPSQLADENRLLGDKEIGALRECLSSGWTSRDRKIFGKWGIWSHLITNSIHMPIDELKNEMLSLYKNQLQYFKDERSKNCLGVVVDGACARIRVSENRTFGEMLTSAFENKTEIADGFEAVRGAAYTIAALEENLPSYRETIIPIEIHHHRRNENGDLENAWKMLIKGTTVPAGSEYDSETNSESYVEGLQIKQNAKILKLTLRRPSANGEDLFRKVSAEISQETSQNEPVTISAKLRPGQGFAKVTIDSVRKGVFQTLLNWRTMEPCDPPPPPPLAYLPKVSRITSDEDQWNSVERDLSAAIIALRDDAPDLLNRLRQLTRKINRWLLADREDELRGRKPKGDIFLYYGVFPSDGSLTELHNPSLAKEFIDECSRYFIKQGLLPRIKETVQRTVSWSYLACPSTIVESARENFNRNRANTSIVDLHTAGLCWEKPKDIQLFFTCLEQVFHTMHGGINEWLRAIRNIVRFRDNALRPEIVNRNCLENIISGLLRTLENQVYGWNIQDRITQINLEGIEIENQHVPNLKQIFNNCVLSILYLLKRRRYEPDFMSSESEHYRRLNEIFSSLIERKNRALNNRQLKIVSITLKFLRMEASYGDLEGIMIEK
jgi:hypothetical protein